MDKNDWESYIQLKSALDVKFEAGRQEATLKITQNLLRLGIDMNVIMTATELSRKQIEQIAKTL